jgi:cell fate (sporulation/competence/biofilm development) regulator YlbF (YheA/YmcA/DUF963 family)
VISEKAQELGRQIGQTEEYKALRRSQEALEAEEALKPKLQRLQELSETLERKLAQAEEPTDTEKDEYGRLVEDIQQNGGYQQMVAAQANFDKLMYRVNQQIMEGIREGATSRIITLD